MLYVSFGCHDAIKFLLFQRWRTILTIPKCALCAVCSVHFHLIALLQLLLHMHWVNIDKNLHIFHVKLHLQTSASLIGNSSIKRLHGHGIAYSINQHLTLHTKWCVNNSTVQTILMPSNKNGEKPKAKTKTNFREKEKKKRYDICICFYFTSDLNRVLE